MNAGFSHFIETCVERCNTHLNQVLVSEARTTAPAIKSLIDAGVYSTSNGGKRIRAILVYAAAQAVGAPEAARMLDHPACAIELIHAYSLIHDDLPAMDDDDLRRGKPSLHKAYDEPTAILVGDGLQSLAFELLADAPAIGPAQKVAMIKTLAAAAGSSGMVGGQFIDISSIGKQLTLDELQAMHMLKTGALIRASLALGGLAADAGKQQLAALDTYGTQIGLAFQVVDDILDVEADATTLGKTPGKDASANKPTYVSLLGLEGAKIKADHLLNASLEALEDFGDEAGHLRDLARYIVQRKG